MSPKERATGIEPATSTGNIEIHSITSFAKPARGSILGRAYKMKAA